MNYHGLLEIGDYINNINIPNISDDTNFWFIRTKSGYFYNEFLNGKYVALGWNIIDKKTLFTDANVKLLKDKIREMYGDRRPGTAINKCRRFIEEVKTGDYLLIPNAGSTEVTIAIAGEYYEEEKDYWQEIHANKKIDNRESEIGRIDCPYKKRRKIDVLMRISSKRLGYKLLKGISSYHGISDMKDYAVDILNCVYDCYTYKGDLRYSFNIAKREPIKAREMSKLMYSVTELFCNLTEEDLVSVTMNLNSPGKVTVLLEKGYDKIKKGAIPLLAIYLVVFGGSGFGFEFNGITGGVVEAIKEYKTMDTEIELKEEELKGKKLENYKAAIELIKMSEDNEINIDEVLRDLEIVDELNDSLQFESNKEFATSDQEQIEE